MFCAQGGGSNSNSKVLCSTWLILHSSRPLLSKKKYLHIRNRWPAAQFLKIGAFSCCQKQGGEDTLLLSKRIWSRQYFAQYVQQFFMHRAWCISFHFCAFFWKVAAASNCLVNKNKTATRRENFFSDSYMQKKSANIPKYLGRERLTYCRLFLGSRGGPYKTGRFLSRSKNNALVKSKTRHAIAHLYHSRSMRKMMMKSS